MSYGISFDFWNTLYANGPEDLRREKRTEYFYQLIRSKKIITIDQIKDVFDLSFDYFITEWKGKHRTPTTVERIQFMTNVLEVELDQGEIEETYHYFSGIIEEIPPANINGISELLPQLSRRFNLGIISDTGYISGWHIRKFLEQQNILQHFQSLLFSDEQGLSKPHRDMFLRTSENLGVHPERLIHIGDLERTDIGGAVDAGCIAVLFTGASGNNGSDTLAQYILSDYSELEEILASIIN